VPKADSCTNDATVSIFPPDFDCFTVRGDLGTVPSPAEDMLTHTGKLQKAHERGRRARSVIAWRSQEHTFANRGGAKIRMDGREGVAPGVPTWARLWHPARVEPQKVEPQKVEPQKVEPQKVRRKRIACRWYYSGGRRWIGD
jgi:hypothetical protein